MALKSLSSRAIIGFTLNQLDGPSDDWISQITNFLNTDQESETYADIGSAPIMREWVGGRQVKQLREMGFTIRNKKYEATLEVQLDDVRRDRTGKIEMKIRQLAERAKDHDAKLLTTLLAAGASSLCYDGQYFFDTDHSEGDSGTQSNSLTYDVTTPAAPTVAEAETAILKATEQMFGFKDDQGEPINGSASRFLLMVPVNHLRAFAGALGTTTILEGGQSRNALIPAVGAIGGLTYGITINPRLSATDAFYMFRADGVEKPLIRQLEVDTQVSAIAEGSEEEFKNERHLYGIKRILGVGFGDWKGAIKTTLT
jgi:phage major head subunit gpT-like protein